MVTCMAYSTRLASDEIKTPTQPARLLRESCAQVKLQQSSIPLHDIESNAPLQLAQIDRAQVHRASIALGQVVRAVHEAMKIDAVLDAEHVRHLVRQYLAAPLEQERSGRARPRVVEARVVARKAVDADPLMKRSLAEHEIPRRIRVQVVHRDTKDRVRVVRHPRPQKRQDVGREQLPVMRERIQSSGYPASRNVEYWKHVYVEREKAGGECLELRERRTGASDELAQRLQIQLVMLAVRSAWAGAEEVGKALSRLGVIGEPIVGARPRQRSEVRSRLQGPAQRVREAIGRTDGLQPFLDAWRCECAHCLPRRHDAGGCQRDCQATTAYSHTPSNSGLIGVPVLGR